MWQIVALLLHLSWDAALHEMALIFSAFGRAAKTPPPQPNLWSPIILFFPAQIPCFLFCSFRFLFCTFILFCSLSAYFEQKGVSASNSNILAFGFLWLKEKGKICTKWMIVQYKIFLKSTCFINPKKGFSCTPWCSQDGINQKCPKRSPRQLQRYNWGSAWFLCALVILAAILTAWITSFRQPWRDWRRFYQVAQLRNLQYCTCFNSWKGQEFVPEVSLQQES